MTRSLFERAALTTVRGVGPPRTLSVVYCDLSIFSGTRSLTDPGRAAGASKYRVILSLTTGPTINPADHRLICLALLILLLTNIQFDPNVAFPPTVRS